MATKIVISKVSEPYADALLELAKANNCVDAITADVNDLLTFLTSVPLLASYFENPVISMANKKNVKRKILHALMECHILQPSEVKEFFFSFGTICSISTTYFLDLLATLRRWSLAKL